LLYNAVLIDLSNLFYRLKGHSKNSLDITKKLINYVEEEVKGHLTTDGVIYILFDPLSYSDLGENKAFAHSTIRKKILPDYKANRKYSDLFLETIELFRKYYFYRGDSIKLVYSDEFEADDFLDPILTELLEKVKFSSANYAIALISTDHDWSAYICNSGGRIIHLINKGFNAPFTVEEFEKIYQFKPNKTSIILYLTLFGDSSDNITGTIFVKKAKFLHPDGIKQLSLNFINFVNENNLQLDDVIKIFKTAKYFEIQNKKEKSVLEELYLQLKINDLKLPIMQTFFNNISIIRSQLENKNISEFVHCNKINTSINSIIHQSIFGINFKTIFGKA
jgi:5'-3' exonuclease